MFCPCTFLLYTCTVSIAVKQVQQSVCTCTVTCNESYLESVCLVNISDKTKMKMKESILISK